MESVLKTIYFAYIYNYILFWFILKFNNEKKKVHQHETVKRLVDNQSSIILYFFVFWKKQKAHISRSIS